MSATGSAGTASSPGGMGAVIAAIIIGAVAFILFNVVRDMAPVRVDTAAGERFRCSVLSVFDGDGPIACSEVDQDGQPVLIRLRGIEAREMDDTCHQFDLCPDASGQAAKAELSRLAAGRLECVSYGPTSFGRVGALCRNGRGVDLSCAMLKSGMAARWAQYDPEGRLLGCQPKKIIR
ncbi:thermonuclease family protein [Novosphingobium sp. 9U]|uniref:thermonuclease family protein n=1 Tax=Novosphingobium sp. 9U TaxID=2653158 RepID=UPI001356F18C|nr:hypothetical protein [Novosphingobium sp. 9U]